MVLELYTRFLTTPYLEDYWKEVQMDADIKQILDMISSSVVKMLSKSDEEVNLGEEKSSPIL